MQIHSVSFGKKIPLISCKVRNNQTGKFERAKLYEYDCKDRDDIDEFAKLPDYWGFKYSILSGMCEKKVVFDKHNVSTGVSYYVLKDKDDETIGICSAKNDSKNFGVKLIQTSPAKTHKYVGQAMLASLAMLGLKNNRNKFEIRYPTDEAMFFYTDKCGFKKGESKFHLEMDRKGMKKLVRNVQARTRSQIVDLSV